MLKKFARLFPSKSIRFYTPEPKEVKIEKPKEDDDEVPTKKIRIRGSVNRYEIQGFLSIERSYVGMWERNQRQSQQKLEAL